ncbi:hypothetical protein [Komagataeibacter oboediens]|uniref:hypothetical protein n=1 Tax=Komagataeibacter oboediens TaxID=65958 RepID=UPI0015E8BAD6|nr:hypothetical protein [Komagataeibacter oboediens]
MVEPGSTVKLVTLLLRTISPSIVAPDSLVMLNVSPPPSPIATVLAFPFGLAAVLSARYPAMVPLLIIVAVVVAVPTLVFSEPDPKVFEQYQPVVIHPSLRRDGVNGDMDWYCPT